MTAEAEADELIGRHNRIKWRMDMFEHRWYCRGAYANAFLDILGTCPEADRKYALAVVPYRLYD